MCVVASLKILWRGLWVLKVRLKIQRANSVLCWTMSLSSINVETSHPSEVRNVGAGREVCGSSLFGVAVSDRAVSTFYIRVRFVGEKDHSHWLFSSQVHEERQKWWKQRISLINVSAFTQNDHPLWSSGRSLLLLALDLSLVSRRLYIQPIEDPAWKFFSTLSRRRPQLALRDVHHSCFWMLSVFD